mgnify:CR=1 FL=1
MCRNGSVAEQSELYYLGVFIRFDVYRLCDETNTLIIHALKVQVSQRLHLVFFEYLQLAN